MTRKQRQYERLKWGIVMLLIASFYMFNISSLSSWSIVLFSGLLFCVDAVQHRGVIHVPLTAFHGMVLAFSLFCFASALWADDSMAAISKGVTVFELLGCMSIVFWCCLEKPSTRDLLTAIMWSGVVIAAYTMFFYGPAHFFAMVMGSIRIGNDYANANAIGSWAAICTVLFLYFIMNEGWRWKYCALIMPVLLVAMSQSRTAFLEVIFGVIMVVYFRYRDQKNFLRSLFRIAAALCILIIVFVALSQLRVFSGLTERVQSLLDFYGGRQVREGSVYQRKAYIQAGLEQFVKTPFFGVGIGNTNQIAKAATGHNTYLHNNFVELLASGGIFGFGLYYGITLYLIAKLLPYAMKKQTVSDACLMILAVHTIADYATVSYYTKGTYFILMTCFLQVYLNTERRVRDAN